MADENPQSEVPQELQQNKQNKDLAAEKAQDKIDNEVTKGEAFLVAIGYISFLCVLPLVLLRDSKFAQYHGKQALVLAIFIYFFDFVQILPAVAASIYTALKTIVVIYALYKSFNGQYFKIPFIYNLSQKFDINIQEKTQ